LPRGTATSSGKVVVNGGRLRVNGGSIIFGGSPTEGTALFQLNSGVVRTRGFTSHSAVGANSAIEFNGGTLEAADNEFLLHSTVPQTRINGNFTIDTRGFSPRINTPIGGSGSLTKAGSGTLSFERDSTFSGTITIMEGEISLGAGGNSGTTGSGNIILQTAGQSGLQFRRSTTPFTFANQISGAGYVKQMGAGGAKTILLANNTYSGSTIIGSHLQVGNGGTAGSLGSGEVDLSSSATLTFARSDNVIFSNSFSTSSSGKVIQNGTGTLTLMNSGNIYLDVKSGVVVVPTGVSISYRDPIVDNSDLVINGTLLTFSSDIKNNGSLRGNGVHNGHVNIRTGSDVSGGNSIGILQIGTSDNNRELRIFDGSLLAEYDGASVDFLRVMGTLSLAANSNLILSKIGADIPRNQWFEIVSYNSLSGSFGSINSSVPFIIDYDHLGLNRIAIMAVPEPTNLFALLGVLFSFCFFTRRNVCLDLIGD
jgi:fibronectin-binding autotransporter adhesin